MSSNESILQSYHRVSAALFVLFILTIGAAYLPLGAFSAVVALLIAGTKAALVAGIFMHLKYASGVMRIFAGAGLLWLIILIGLSLTDFLTRG